MSDYTLEEFDVEGLTIKIQYDDSPESPREWDNLGELYLKGGRQGIEVDETTFPSYGQFWNKEYREYDEIHISDMTTDQFEAHAEKYGYLWLPVYRYEHSGVAYKTTPFYCPWDSGQNGYIVVDKAKVRKEWKVKRISAKLHKTIISNMQGEVSTYSEWASGEVYGFVVEDEDGEHLDSCWGFYGLDYCKEEATTAAKYQAESRKVSA